MKIIECPRDAMQGIKTFIPTRQKIAYLKLLLRVGFDTLDCGSFVSPGVVPQLCDTAEVFAQLDMHHTRTRILAIVANLRGADNACLFDIVDYIGFPLSLSETFQQLNTNSSIECAFDTLYDIQELCVKRGKILVCYVSMGFGNPYGEVYDVDNVARFVEALHKLNIRIVSLSDTVGMATADQISRLFSSLVQQFPQMELGVHLHSTQASSREKIAAAYQAGCTRFDGALRGWGGCPMAQNELVGNIATETILDYLHTQHAAPDIDSRMLMRAAKMTDTIFGKHVV